MSFHPAALSPSPKRRHSLLHEFKSLPAASIGRIHFLPAFLSFRIQLSGRTGMELVGWFKQRKGKSKDRKKWMKWRREWYLVKAKEKNAKLGCGGEQNRETMRHQWIRDREHGKNWAGKQRKNRANIITPGFLTYHIQLLERNPRVLPRDSLLTQPV